MKSFLPVSGDDDLETHCGLLDFANCDCIVHNFFFFLGLIPLSLVFLTILINNI